MMRRATRSLIDITLMEMTTMALVSQKRPANAIDSHRPLPRSYFVLPPSVFSLEHIVITEFVAEKWRHGLDPGGIQS